MRRPGFPRPIALRCATAWFLGASLVDLTGCSVYGTELLARPGADSPVDADAGDASRESRTDDVAVEAAIPDVGAESPDGEGDETVTDADGVDRADTSVAEVGSETSAPNEGGEADAPGADASGAADSAEGSAVQDAGDGALGTLVFADDFERNTVGQPAAGWTRVGGSGTDWEVATDAGLVFQQDRSLSTTLRFCYAGPVRSGAGSVSARVKVLANGTSSVTTALVCIRYAVNGTAFDCLALEPGVGLQIKTMQGDGPVWPTGVSMGIWYALKLGIDASGMLTAYVDGVTLGSMRPAAAVDNSPIAVGTQSAEAAFDDVVLTTP